MSSQRERFNLIDNHWIQVLFLLVMSLVVLSNLLGIETPIHKSRKTLIERDTSGVFEVDFHGGFKFYRITKDLDGLWKINDSISIRQNLAKMYIAQFEKIETKNHIASFDTTSVATDKISKLIVKSADAPTEIQLICYEVGHRDYKYLIQSSQFPTLFFRSQQNGLYRKLFWERERWE